MTDVNTCSCWHCTEQRKEFERVKRIILQNRKCSKCDKEASHEFLIDKKSQHVEYACMNHSKDYDRQMETHMSIVKRLEALYWFMYPYNRRIYLEKDQQQVINKDPNLKRYVEKRIEYEYKKERERLKSYNECR